MTTGTFKQTFEEFCKRLGVDPNAPPVPPPPPACSLCDDQGYYIAVSASDPTSQKVRHCDCEAGRAQRNGAAAKLLTRSGLPDRYAQLTFASWMSMPETERVGKEAASGAAWLWAQGRPFALDEALGAVGARTMGASEQRAWVVLQGGLGVGKTGLASAAVNEMASSGRACLFYRLAELFADVQGRYGQTDGLTADSLLDQVKGAPALVLDEMNVPKASDDKQRIVEEIIRYRHGRDLPTMITCNVNAREFAAMWGERTADVVMEQSHWIAVAGAKLRRGASVLAAG